MPAPILLGKVNSRSRFEETVGKLSQVIAIGVVPEGERLPPERELAAMLGVSRMTVREGLRALEQAGMIQVRRGRNGGAYVTAAPRQRPSRGRAAELVATMGTDLDDLIDFRGAVEPAGAALAAARRGNDDIQLLRELLDASRDAASADSAAFRGPDARLHLAICDAASSSLILEAAIEIQVRLNEVLAITPILDQAILHSHQQHAEIIAAIEAGDAASARSRMEEHLEGTRELILTLTQPARE